ncbi:MAG: MarR family winged helix-turn-helix transcriptional regulator [Alphaproteobacteria bacterium]
MTKPRKRAPEKVRTSGDAAALHLPLWSRPGYLVRRLHQIHLALFLEECKAYGITPVQYGLLTALAAHPGLDQVSLAAELGIDRTNVADVLVRLADRGLVRRAASAEDRRVKRAHLTEEGSKLTARMHGAMQRAQDRLVAPLALAERRQFMALLTRLIEANNEFSRAPFRPR